MVLLHILLCTLSLRVVTGANPTWTNPGMAQTVAIDEDVGSGASVYDLVADDADDDNLTYSIASQTPAAPAFTLSDDQLQAPDGLDADSGPTSFDFEFNVTDGNTNVTSAVLTVTITDVSDNDPMFSADPYTASIADGASNGDSVVTVSATPDVVGAPITYTLTGGNTPDTFEIDSSTGVITVKDATNVNSAITSSYSLSVEADDGTNTATVTVSITVTGNTAPTWDSPASAASSDINENVPAGTSVYTLGANDTEGDTLTFGIFSQTPQSPMFTLSGTQVQAPAMLEADAGITSYVLIFNVSDGTTTVNSAALTVTVTDLPDEDPVFGQSSYSATITDSATTGLSVLTVSATPDVTGSTITYNLTGGNNPDTFQLDSNTGEITVKDAANVDSATTPSYTLSVEASDGTNSATVNVTISVTANSVAKPCFRLTCLMQIVSGMLLLRTLM